MALSFGGDKTLCDLFVTQVSSEAARYRSLQSLVSWPVARTLLPHLVESQTGAFYLQDAFVREEPDASICGLCKAAEIRCFEGRPAKQSQKHSKLSVDPIHRF
jgi:hypothetical protein